MFRKWNETKGLAEAMSRTYRQEGVTSHGACKRVRVGTRIENDEQTRKLDTRPMKADMDCSMQGFEYCGRKTRAERWIKKERVNNGYVNRDDELADPIWRGTGRTLTISFTRHRSRLFNRSCRGRAT